MIQLRMTRWLRAGLAAMPFLLPAVADADVVYMVDGDRVTGTVVERTADTIVIDHPTLGRLTVPMTAVSSIVADDAPPLTNTDTATDPSTVAVTPPADDGEVLAPADADSIVEDETDTVLEVPKWKYNILVGTSGASGNSENASLNARFGGVREAPDMRTSFELVYFFATEDGNTTDDKFYAAGLQDWLIGDSRWLYFADARFDYDKFQSWDYRFAAHGGIGYQLVQTDAVNITARVGAGPLKEWGSTNDDWRLEGLASADLVWRITETQTFEIGGTYFPDFSNSGEFRTFSYANWRWLLNEDLNLSLTAGLQHEYQSTVDPGDNFHYDFRWVFGLQMDF